MARDAKVLLLGKDGRTDCMAEALRASGAALHVLCDLAHPGLREKATQFRRARTDDVGAVVAFAREVRPDLAVIGPEDPLAAGVVDALEELGVPAVGPTRALARLESSKSFTRALLGEHGIEGNVEHRVFRAPDGLPEYLRRLGEFVVKPDGLTGGKGVKALGDQLASLEEGLAYARELLARGAGPVVVEERLEGEEFSLQSFCDGATVVDMIPVQDHKRAFEGDRGPNTGGMGSYSCPDHALPFLAPEDLAAASRINRKVAEALHAKLGRPYRGILYGGFMATADGVRVLEYNARFGDPEAMNVLPLLRGSFLEICTAVATGTLHRVRVAFEPKASVCKYLVPRGYPELPCRGEAIGVEGWRPGPDRRLYWAAVDEDAGRLVMTGSRAVALVGLADSVADAGRIVEEAAAAVTGPLEHRRDIGTPELLARRVAHLRALRSGA